MLRRCAESRPNPKRRDEDFVRTAVALATRAQPFAGHKAPPLLCRWPDWGWYRMNVPDLMHGMTNYQILTINTHTNSHYYISTLTRRHQGGLRKHNVSVTWFLANVMGQKE